MKIPQVLSDRQQALSETEQKQARDNIGCASQASFEALSERVDNIHPEYEPGAGIDISGSTISVKYTIDPVTGAVTAIGESPVLGKVYEGEAPVNVDNEQDKISVAHTEVLPGTGISFDLDDEGRTIINSTAESKSSYLASMKLKLTRTLTDSSSLINMKDDGADETLTREVSYHGCTAENCPVSLSQDSHDRYIVHLTAGHPAVTAHCTVFVDGAFDQKDKFLTWGFDSDYVQAIPGASRDFELNDGEMLLGNGIHPWLPDATSGYSINGTITLEIVFTVLVTE